MLERRTFIVRILARAPPILEDVATGEHVRLPDIAALASEIERRLDHPAYVAPAAAAAAQHDGRA